MDSSGNTINETNKATYEPPTIERVTPPAERTRDDDEILPQAQASPVPRENHHEHEQENEERVQLLPDDDVEQDDDDDETNNNLLLCFKGEFQPPAYRDAWCAVVFVTQLVAVLVTASVYGPAAFDSTTTAYHNNTTNTTTTITTTIAADSYLGDDTDDNNEEEKDESFFVALDMLYVLLATSGFFVAATMTTMACLRVMTLYPTHVVKVSFFTAPLTLGAVAILATIAASTTTTASSDDNDDDDDDDMVVSLYLWLVVAIFAAVSICWYKCFQRFIPFAASTLRTALTAIRGQGLGLYALEIALLLGLYAYTAVWLIAVGGVYAHGLQQTGPSCYQDDNGSGNDDMCDNVPINLPVAFFLLLSLYWTQQVVQNLVHTTTSVSDLVRSPEKACNVKHVTQGYFVWTHSHGVSWCISMPFAKFYRALSVRGGFPLCKKKKMLPRHESVVEQP